MTASTLSGFLLASVLLTLAPGPDNMYLLAKSLTGGAKSGIVLAGGLASGIVFHTGLVIAGVAALVRESPTAFSALKYIGAAYLLYLAAGAFRGGDGIKLGDAGGPSSLIALYKRGVLMNILNPKVLLFFLAFLPQFVNAESGGTSAQIAMLGLLFSAQGFTIFSVMAICAGRIGRAIANGKNIGRTLSRVEGVVLLAISVALVFG